MSMTLLSSKEDFEWLGDVHLKGIDLSKIKVAILHGNEDCPEKVELFKRNHYKCRPIIFSMGEDGTLRQVSR